MSTNKKLILACGLLLMLAWMPLGCGGDSSVQPAPSFFIDKSTYDFGSVTVGKTATLQVLISNQGTANLSVDELTLSDLVNFDITSNTCGVAPYTIAAGADCSVTLTFSPTAVGPYSETLVITSNDGAFPVFTVTLLGEGKAAEQLTVSLNQIDAVGCPIIKAYVTVTDQNGFGVEGLVAADFEFSENIDAASGGIDTVVIAQNAALPFASAIVMDYSGSVTFDPVFLSAMEQGAIAFVGQMGGSDQSEIIKFATVVEVTQPFTSDKNLLETAIPGVPDLGTKTALYDAIYKGIEDAAATTANRQAVIVLTDGVDNGSSGIPGSVPGSVHDLAEVIDLAQSEGVPVFTIGIGDGVDSVVLQEIAGESGGQYFEGQTTDRIMTIYTQLSEILINQYVLTYETPLSGTDVDVVVTVLDQPGVIGDASDPLTYTGCP